MRERSRAARVVEGGAVEARPFLAMSASGPASDPIAEAFERGRDAGREEGRREAEAAYAAALAANRSELARSLERIASLQESITNRHEGVLVEIAIEAAARLLRQRIAAGDPVAVRAVREGLEALPRSAAIRVRVHPEDIPALEDDLRVEIERGRIEIAADPGVARGGSFLESPLGTVDATVEAGADAVRAAALGEAEGA